MARAFHADPVHMNVALTSYLFALAVFIPASGWMADRFGTRNVFRAAIAVFTLGSVLCGRADSLGFLVAARILQGVGGAMMLPVGRLVLLRSVPKDRLIGGDGLGDHAGAGRPGDRPAGRRLHRHLFLVELDLRHQRADRRARLRCWSALFIEDMREPDPGRFDIVGLLLTGLTLGGFMAVLELAGRDLVPPDRRAGAGAVAVPRPASSTRCTPGGRRALLDFSLLRLPTFAVSVLAGSLFRVGIGAMPFLLPLLIQVGFGRSAAQSGMITFASAAGAIGMKPATQWVLRRLRLPHRAGRQRPGLRGLLLAAYAAFRPTWPLAALYGVLMLGGMLRSLQFTAYNAVAYADVPPGAHECGHHLVRHAAAGLADHRHPDQRRRTLHGARVGQPCQPRHRRFRAGVPGGRRDFRAGLSHIVAATPRCGPGDVGLAQRRPSMRRAFALFLLAIPLTARAAPKPLTVFAAASLTNAMQDVGVLWMAAGHGRAGVLLRCQLHPGPADRARRPGRRVHLR